jgi:putative Mg2+ transporter-C (MgtC) family protein
MMMSSSSEAAATAGYSSNPPLSTPQLTDIIVKSSPMSVTAQLQLTFRLVHAALLGAVIGKERSGKSHHPAGVRTMALVSVGAAMFTISSMYGFAAIGKYDPSRMAANVASGVGFIGAGVITTSSSSSDSEERRGGGSIVHGLTTAAAIWLSAATGVGCGVGMCILSTAAAVLTVTILRVGRVAQSLQEKVLREDLLLKERLLLRNNNNKRQRRRNRFSNNNNKANHKYEDEGMRKNGREDHHRDHEERLLFPSSDGRKTPILYRHEENQNDLYEEREDQLFFQDVRPDTGWNETDKMDA